MPYLSTESQPSVELCYDDQGAGQPIVMIHCWPLSHQVWARQTAALTAAGFRCIAYDRRGFGDSGKPEMGYDYDTFAADLHALIVALDLREVILAGYSMGGGEVVRYLTRYGTERIAKVMLISTVLPFPMRAADNPDGVPREVYEGLISSIEMDADSFIGGISRAFVGWSDDQADRLTAPFEEVLALAQRADSTAVAGCVRAFGMTDFRGEIANITVPALIVHGTADSMVPAATSSLRLTEMLPGSTLVLIAGGPHGLAITHGAELSEAMVGFATAKLGRPNTLDN